MENKMNYPEMLFLFFVGSVLGFLLEGAWRVIRTGAWENHAATVWGPFCIIYGFGATALYWISGQVNDLPIWGQFLLYALIGAAVEYLGSWVQELVFGSVSWDYSNKFLNINGRICLSTTLMWGLLGVVFSQLCAPATKRFFGLASDWPIKGLCVIISVFMAFDLLVSAGALIRWRERQDNLPARTRIDEQLDEYFDDQRMEEIYNNMVFVKKKEISGRND